MKTIQITMKVDSQIDNFELCEFIEKQLQSTVLGSSPYNLEIKEVKVTKTESYVDSTNVSS